MIPLTFSLLPGSRATISRRTNPSSRRQGSMAELSATVPAAPTGDAWSNALQQFEMAADKLKLDSNLRAVLRQPKRELTVNFPVRMDNGSVEVFTGYRVH